MQPSSDQMSLFEEPPLPRPGACEFEARCISVGAKPKSECVFVGTVIWTNCREWERCIWDGWWQRGSRVGSQDASGGGDEE